MDSNKIGMVDFEQFYRFLKVEKPIIDLINHIERPNYQATDPGELVEDSFQWQYDIIAKIKEWFRKEKHHQRDLNLTYQDAFKSFDIDFDGKVSKDDMKIAVYSFLKVPPSEITDLRMDRLFRLLSFYKTETL